MTNKVINILGNEIHYLIEENNKPKIMFIHGFSASSKSFDELLKLENRPYDMVLLDLPGHGKSSHSEELSVKLFQKVVDKFIEELDLNNLIVVGHSLGAMSALHLNKNPRVSKVILYSPFNPFIHAHALSYIRANRINNLQANVGDILSIVRNAGKKYAKLGQKDILSLKNRNEVVLPLYEQNRNVPIIAGSEDKVVRPITIDHTAREFDSHVIYINGAKHSAAKTHPVEFNKALLDLINT